MLGGLELLRGFGDVDDAFDQANQAGQDAAKATGYEGDRDHDHAGPGIAQHELVDAQATQENAG